MLNAGCLLKLNRYMQKKQKRDKSGMWHREIKLIKCKVNMFRELLKGFILLLAFRGIVHLLF